METNFDCRQHMIMCEKLTKKGMKTNENEWNGNIIIFYFVHQIKKTKLKTTINAMNTSRNR